MAKPHLLQGEENEFLYGSGLARAWLELGWVWLRLGLGNRTKTKPQPEPNSEQTRSEAGNSVLSLDEGSLFILFLEEGASLSAMY